jgi:hypothetical protein|tara:strand:- start:128 stop:298 length:171 start_codon:yes stop_codon:yes gene_type:complete
MEKITPKKKACAHQEEGREKIRGQPPLFIQNNAQQHANNNTPTPSKTATVPFFTSC